MTNKKNISLNEILVLYHSGKTPIEIAELLSCTHSNISKRLKRSGVPFHRDYTKTRYSRKGRYAINESFFDRIDTPEKAYFLGLLFADGSVTENGFYIKLKDEDILLRLKECMESEHPVKRIYYGGYSAYIFTVGSKKLASALIHHGCVPNKTRCLHLPTLDSKLYRHFIRGFYDGDGSLILHKEFCKSQFNLTSASLSFLKELSPIIESISSGKGSISKETLYDVWHLRFCGKRVAKIMDWLYNDTSLYLKRKYRKYLMLGPLKTG